MQQSSVREREVTFRFFMRCKLQGTVRVHPMWLCFGLPPVATWTWTLSCVADA